MAWIATVPPGAATGPLQQQYDAAKRRAGRIWSVVRLMSPNPPALAAAMSFYLTLMVGPSPLSRRQREMLAVVVSVTNGCRY